MTFDQETQYISRMDISKQRAIMRTDLGRYSVTIGDVYALPYNWDDAQAYAEFHNFTLENHRWVTNWL